MKYLVICRTCEDCGDKHIVKIFDESPTYHQVRPLEYELGGMHCISSEVVEIEENESAEFRF